MANQYEEERQYWQDLETNPVSVSPDIWEVLDSLLVNKIDEMHSIFVNKDFNISRSDGIIIVGLIQSAAAFINSIKTADNIGINKEGFITLNKGIHHLIGHCVRNDLNIILCITELKVSFNESIADQKDPIGKAFKETSEVINRLKKLTRG